MLELGQQCIKPLERLLWLELLATKNLSKNEFRVAATLQSFCNSKTGQLNPGRERLAQLTRLAPCHVSTALSNLKRRGCIREVESTSRAKKWEIIYLCERFEICNPKGFEICNPKGSKSVTQNLSSEPEKENQSLNLSDTLPQKSDSGAPNGTWRPKPDHVKYFFEVTGMTTEELQFEIDRFITYNEQQRTLPHLWQDHWIKWCHQIERHKLATIKRKLNGGTALPGITEGIANVLERAKDKTPCYQRFGPKGYDPLKQPDSFMRNGCSIIGGCICSPDRRKTILEGLGHVHGTPKPASELRKNP